MASVKLPVKDNQPEPAGAPRRLLSIILWVVILGMATGGYKLYRQQEHSILAMHCDNLQAMTNIKTDEIMAWRQERLADARMNSSGIISTLTQQWQNAPSPALLDTIRQRLQVFQENEGYDNLTLTDTTGRVMTAATSRSNGLAPEEQALIQQSLQVGQPMIGDFFYSQNKQQPMLHLAAPVFDTDRQAVAVLLFAVNPYREFYPLINNQPMRHHHFITMLLRKDGSDMLLINDPGSADLRPLHYRAPWSHTASPLAQTELGVTGVVRGLDRQGTEVFTCLGAIADSGWYVVMQMDANNILIESRLRGMEILVLVVLGSALVAGLGRLLHLSRQRDISEKMLLLERESNRAKGETRATLYGIGDGVISTDTAGLVSRMNPGAEQLTGWSEQEALGQPLSSVFRCYDEETSQFVSLPLDRVLTKGKGIGAGKPVLLRSRDGRQRPVTDSWSPIRNETGQVIGAVIVFRDQTGRRLLERAQLESARRYTDLVESVNDFIWETGPDHRYTYANRHCFNLLGYTREEFIGKTWFDILCKEVEPEDKIARFRTTLAQHAPYNQLCRTFVRKDGRRVVLESTATPIFDDQWNFQGYRGVTRDITDRKKAEDEQRHLQEQLFQAQKMETIGRLAGGVAHDFNNMLTVICSHVSMILDEINTDHRYAKQLEAVHQAALHSAKLTRQLLTFARKQTVSPKILDLNRTVSESLAMLRYLVGEQIELFWNPGADLWPVRMDVTQLNQILTNLIVNARDAIEGHGCLIIETHNVVLNQSACATHGPSCTPGNYVALSICDDGSGMDQATQQTIFEPFFTTKGEGRGTGLGLAVVYGIVQQNHGLIKVSSEPGAGTSFVVYLPIAHADGSNQPTTTGPSQPQHKKATIVLVEDEPTILELGQAMLQQMGHTVLATHSPLDALQLVEHSQEPIDLLLTDVIMPEMHGSELAARMRQLYPTIKVLYMSGYTADIISDQGGVKNGINLIEKPFSVRALREAIEATLNRSGPCPLSQEKSMH